MILKHRDRELLHFDWANPFGVCRVELNQSNPGLRKNALAKLAGLTERTTKRYLSQLKGCIVFKGAPKTGGYYPL